MAEVSVKKEGMSASVHATGVWRAADRQCDSRRTGDDKTSLTRRMNKEMRRKEGDKKAFPSGALAQKRAIPSSLQAHRLSALLCKKTKVLRIQTQTQCVPCPYGLFRTHSRFQCRHMN